MADLFLEAAKYSTKAAKYSTNADFNEYLELKTASLKTADSMLEA